MEATPALDSDADHRQPSPDRGPILDDLIYASHLSQFIISETYCAKLYHSCAFQSLSGARNRPLVYSPLPEKDLYFFGGVIPQSPQGGVTRIRNICKKYISHTLLKSTSVPAVGIPPLPSKNKFKFKDYNSDGDTQCSYDSDH